MITEKDNEITVTDTTYSHVNRMPEAQTFSTVWQKNPLKFLRLLKNYESETANRVAISRHRKEVEKYLGIYIEKPKKIVKVIFETISYHFYCDEFIEKESSFLPVGSGSIIRKTTGSTAWNYWTPERERLLKELDGKLKEISELRRKILTKEEKRNG